VNRAPQPAQLADVLKHQHDEERERAIRALLMRPLLPAWGPEFVHVRRHAKDLHEWFARECGWSLRVQRDCARLYKRPAALDDSSRGVPGFNRDRYVLLCLVCAVLERSEPQITLQTLGDRLLDAARDAELDALGYRFALEHLRERRDLVQVCRFLLERGVLARVAGDEDAYLTRSGDVLYDVNRATLALLPGSARGASLIATSLPKNAQLSERLSALVEDYVADSPEGRRTAARHRLARRLLDDPVVYLDELDEAERDYLSTQRGAMSARLAAASGLVAELRAEGIALVDPDGELSDEQLPAQGTEAHATLLVAEHLANAARAEPQRLHALREIASFLREAADDYARYWRKAAREPGAELALAEQAITRLERLKLVESVDGGLRARPALLRFSLGAAQMPQRQGSLL
jgi:uncharacterized protein (TIGR02678 family)